MYSKNDIIETDGNEDYVLNSPNSNPTSRFLCQ